MTNDNDESLTVFHTLMNHEYFNRHTIRAFGRDMGVNDQYSGRHDSNDKIATVIAGNVTMQQVNDWLDMRMAPSERVMSHAETVEAIASGVSPNVDEVAATIADMIRSLMPTDETIRAIVRDELRQKFS